MGNEHGAHSAEHSAAMEDGVFTTEYQTKIRLMAALSHDCRSRTEERTHLRERLSEMKAERRRISMDLRSEMILVSPEERVSRVPLPASRVALTRDTMTPASDAYENDKICAECGKEAKRDKNHPCRVCTRVYHLVCLQRAGGCRPADLASAPRALTNEGWSCYRCNNLSSLLTEEEIEHLILTFDEFDKDQDHQVSWEEYRDARGMGGEPHGTGRGRGDDRRMSETSEMVARMEFKMADQDCDHSLDWWEFLNLAAQHALGRRSETELVGLLTLKEVARSKAVFLELDKDRDGVISSLDSRRAVTKWCSALYKGLTPDQVAKLSPTIDSHVEIRARMLIDGDDQHKDTITWPDFLSRQALFILCSRPNMAPNILDNLHDK